MNDVTETAPSSSAKQMGWAAKIVLIIAGVLVLVSIWSPNIFSVLLAAAILLPNGKPLNQKMGFSIPSRVWWYAVVILSIIVAVSLLPASSSEQAAVGGGTNSINPTATGSTVKAKQVSTAPAQRQVSGTAVTLGAGTFTGGKDVAVGLYDVTPGPGQSGNFMVDGSDSYNLILGSIGAGEGVPKARVQISDGDQIQISGMSVVHFTPVTAPFVTGHTTVDLYAGTFVVGEDIGPGRYVATPGPGQSGNFMVDGSDSYNEILGGDSAYGGVPSVTATLSKGDVIDISGLSKVTMTAI